MKDGPSPLGSWHVADTPLLHCGCTCNGLPLDRGRKAHCPSACSPDIVARVIQLEPSTAVALVQLNTLFHRAAAEALYEGTLASIAVDTSPWTDKYSKSSTFKTMIGLFSDHRRAHDMRVCCAILLGVSKSVSIPKLTPLTTLLPTPSYAALVQTLVLIPSSVLFSPECNFEAAYRADRSITPIRLETLGTLFQSLPRLNAFVW